MDILVIGGTLFVGRHFVQASLDAGHNVTLFNRGRSKPGLFADAEEIHGDRDGGLDALKGRKWDMVYDPSGYVPRIVRQSAEFLRDSIGRYVFVSSISVYADQTNMSEDSQALHQLEDPNTEDVLSNYGGLKVACENVVSEIYGDRALNVRPGFIVGAYDTIPRLPVLLQRFDSDGERLAGRPDQLVQFIHARDISDWVLSAVGKGLNGAYNLTGEPFEMQILLDTIVDKTGKDITITYTDDAFLQEHNVAPVNGLTYWVPSAFEILMRASIDKAMKAGLSFKPLPETIQETLTWLRDEGLQTDSVGNVMRQSVVSPEREAELLALWHNR